MSKIWPNQVEQMRAYRARGFSGARIAKFMGLHPSTVRKHLAGMPMPAILKDRAQGLRGKATRQQAFIDRLNGLLAEVRP